MGDKFLCLMATFDDEASRAMRRIECILNDAGIVGRQTPNLPHHITLASFDSDMESELKSLVQDVCATTGRFRLTFNHIGLFDLKVMFLAPDVNIELLELHRKLNRHSRKSERGWTPHTTLLIDESRIIMKALPLVAHNFSQLTATVTSLYLYEFFPTRFVAKYDLPAEPPAD